MDRKTKSGKEVETDRLERVGSSGTSLEGSRFGKGGRVDLLYVSGTHGSTENDCDLYDRHGKNQERRVGGSV